MNPSKTERGFDVVEFKDRYDHGCSLQKSSLAFEDCVWLGVDDADPKVMAVDADKVGVSTNRDTGWVSYPIPAEVSLYTRMHLSREQVKALLPYLQRFVETGEITGRIVKRKKGGAE